MTIRCTTILPILILSLICPGCGLQRVELHCGNINEISAQDVSIEVSEDGTRSITVPIDVEGSSQTLAYDRTLWTFARLPCVRSTDGELVLLDTGLTSPARVTLDVVCSDGHPAHLEDTFSFAYIKSLNLENITVGKFIAFIEHEQWQFRILCLPLYKLRGWALGMPVLRQMSFIRFDNRNREVTLGMETFSPESELRWRQYKLSNRDGRPYVRLPIAGIETELLVDSGGGPNLMLNADQWHKIAKKVKIERRWAKEYPTWDGFDEVNAFQVKRLEIGAKEISSAVIWVLPEASPVVPAIGLGPFENEVVVWDFDNSQYWIGHYTDGSTR